MGGLPWVVAAFAVVLILSAVFKRQVLRAGAIMLAATAAFFFVGHALVPHLSDKGFLFVELLIAAAAIVFAGRQPSGAQPQAPAPAAPIAQTPSQPVVPEQAEQQPLPPIDEKAFQAWLKARGLLNKAHSPEEMLDLRRQFAGVA
jgi:hypothetical protein